jgi:cytochrome c biogenesis protein CcdA
MRETFKFKATYLNKIIWTMVLIGLIITLAIFLGLRMDLICRYFISMIIILMGILIVFYLNRNELDQLNINEEELELIYFNRVFWKRPPSTYLRRNLTFVKTDELFVLYVDNKTIGTVRKVSTDNQSWDKLLSYFK